MVDGLPESDGPIADRAPTFCAVQGRSRLGVVRVGAVPVVTRPEIHGCGLRVIGGGGEGSPCLIGLPGDTGNNKGLGFDGRAGGLRAGLSVIGLCLLACEPRGEKCW